VPSSSFFSFLYKRNDMMVGYASNGLASELILLQEGGTVEAKIGEYVRLCPTATDRFEVGRVG